MLVTQGVDALGAARSSIQILFERVHARVNLQHAATVASRDGRTRRACYAEIMVMRAGSSAGTTADTGVISKLVLVVLLSAA